MTVNPNETTDQTEAATASTGETNQAPTGELLGVGAEPTIVVDDAGNVAQQVARAADFDVDLALPPTIDGTRLGYVLNLDDIETLAAIQWNVLALAGENAKARKWADLTDDERQTKVSEAEKLLETPPADAKDNLATYVLRAGAAAIANAANNLLDQYIGHQGAVLASMRVDGVMAMEAVKADPEQAQPAAPIPFGPKTLEAARALPFAGGAVSDWVVHEPAEGEIGTFKNDDGFNLSVLRNKTTGEFAKG